MYPIINLRNHKMDLHWYLRALEEVIIRVLSSTFSINANRVDGLTGVWAGIPCSFWLKFVCSILEIHTFSVLILDYLTCAVYLAMANIFVLELIFSILNRKFLFFFSTKHCQILEGSMHNHLVLKN